MTNKKALVIGFVGFIGSGKDTAADYLVNFHGFRRDSFANSLKDAISHIFGWDRTLLEGRTIESRHWREQVDLWWAERLKIPHLTPRWVMQYWGTDVLRNNFHDDIWIASLENRMRKTTDNIVISDVRFQNEILSIRNSGGVVVRVKRGKDPDWYDLAFNANQGDTFSKEKLKSLNIHPSETSWIGDEIDIIIDNNRNIDDLYSSLEQMIKNQELSLPAAIEV